MFPLSLGIIIPLLGTHPRCNGLPMLSLVASSLSW